MALQIDRTDTCPYVWVIDFDHSCNPYDERSAMGVSGPRSADVNRRDRMRQDMRLGEQFRMRDGDGELVYAGRIDFGAAHRRTWNWFAPLDQFGKRNAGCTSIEYFEDGKWVEA
jgi:hypothetical protein